MSREHLWLGHRDRAAYFKNLFKVSPASPTHRNVQAMESISRCCSRPPDLSFSSEGLMYAWAGSPFLLFPHAWRMCPLSVPNSGHLGISSFLQVQPSDNPVMLSVLQLFQLGVWSIRLCSMYSSPVLAFSMFSVLGMSHVTPGTVGLCICDGSVFSPGHHMTVSSHPWRWLVDPVLLTLLSVGSFAIPTVGFYLPRREDTSKGHFKIGGSKNSRKFILSDIYHVSYTWGEGRWGYRWLF